MNDSTLSNAGSETISGETKAEATVKTGSASEATTEEVTALAYKLWIERGSPHGSDEEDWLKAEEQLKERAPHLTESAGA